MPACLIEDQDGMSTSRDVKGDLPKVHAHGFAVASGHDDGSAFAFCGTDRPKDPCRSPAQITGRDGSRPALGPATGDLRFLTDPGLVLPPEL